MDIKKEVTPPMAIAIAAAVLLLLGGFWMLSQGVFTQIANSSSGVQVKPRTGKPPATTGRESKTKPLQ